MSEHRVEVNWAFAPGPLDENTYNRNHRVTLSGGQQVNASSAPEYKGDPACADPEQLLISALASCHMLTFLAIAEHKGYEVKSYHDKATGYLEKGDNGRPQVTRIELQPVIIFSDNNQPDSATLKRMHDSAHRGCFIANSIKTKVEILES